MRSIWFLAMLGLVGNLLAQSTPELKDVKAIYVDQFGNDEGADVIRSKVITELVKTGKVKVVLDREQADAILIGGGTVAQPAGRVANATAGVQLIDQHKNILWADSVTVTSSLFNTSATTNLAENIVTKLMKAIDKAGKKK